MTPEDPVRKALDALDTAGPSASFVADLRGRLEHELANPDPSSNSEVVMITATKADETGDERREGRSRQRTALVALLAALLVAGGLGALWSRGSGSTSTDQDPAGEGTTTTSVTTTAPTTTVAEPTSTSVPAETLAIGEAWIDSIITNDRETFAALHAEDITTNDTLMSWTALVPRGMDRATVAGLYLDGFDAFQASIETDDDTIEVIECEVTGQRNHIARCGFRASLVGGDETFIVSADLSIQDGLIQNVVFTGGNNPPDLMSRMLFFIRDFGTEQDIACRDIGFNSIECGRHESDLLTRYLSFLADDEGS